VRLILGGLLALALFPAAAQTTLDRPDAFEHAYALSLYQFDACGDPMAGQLYRRALAARFAQCPFSPDARGRYTQQTQAHLARTRQWMEDMVERDGGLPVQLKGMTTTCHALQASGPYVEFRGLLDAFNAGTLTADAIIPAACDAPDLAP